MISFSSREPTKVNLGGGAEGAKLLNSKFKGFGIQAPCCAGADTVVDTCAMLAGIIAA
jgi:hypothetical protein